MKGSSIENDIAGGMVRQATPVGSGAKNEQQEQQEQVEVQPSVPCRSEQGQCEAGWFGAAISNRAEPLCREGGNGGSRFAKVSSGRSR